MNRWSRVALRDKLISRLPVRSRVHFQKHARSQIDKTLSHRFRRPWVVLFNGQAVDIQRAGGPRDFEPAGSSLLRIKSKKLICTSATSGRQTFRQFIARLSLDRKYYFDYDAVRMLPEFPNLRARFEVTGSKNLAFSWAYDAFPFFFRMASAILDSSIFTPRGSDEKAHSHLRNYTNTRQGLDDTSDNEME